VAELLWRGRAERGCTWRGVLIERAASGPTTGRSSTSRRWSWSSRRPPACSRRTRRVALPSWASRSGRGSTPARRDATAEARGMPAPEEVRRDLLWPGVRSPVTARWPLRIREMRFTGISMRRASSAALMPSASRSSRSVSPGWIGSRMGLCLLIGGGRRSPPRPGRSSPRASRVHHADPEAEKTEGHQACCEMRFDFR